MSSASVHYLIQDYHELPANDRWLSPAEASILAGLTVPKRRRDWRLGRWTAKQALARLFPAEDRPPADWCISADADGAPAASLDGRPVDVSISLSHSAQTALCLLAPAPTAVGCDLERIEARARAFEETWFSDTEIALLDRAPVAQRVLLATLVWSAKESALKLLKTGLRADTRRVRVDFDWQGQGRDWCPLSVEDTADASVFHGWWRVHDRLVVTVAADRPTNPPVALQR